MTSIVRLLVDNKLLEDPPKHLSLDLPIAARLGNAEYVEYFLTSGYSFNAFEHNEERYYQGLELAAQAVGDALLEGHDSIAAAILAKGVPPADVEYQYEWCMRRVGGHSRWGRVEEFRSKLKAISGSV